MSSFAGLGRSVSYIQGGWKYSDRKYSDNVGNIRTMLEIFGQLFAPENFVGNIRTDFDCRFFSGAFLLYSSNPITGHLKVKRGKVPEKDPFLSETDLYMESY